MSCWWVINSLAKQSHLDFLGNLLQDKNILPEPFLDNLQRMEKKLPLMIEFVHRGPEKIDIYVLLDQWLNLL